MSLSTHVLDAASVRPAPGVSVALTDGRIALSAGICRLRFEVTDSDGHYHVPLLLSPYAYSTYRGS